MPGTAAVAVPATDSKNDKDKKDDKKVPPAPRFAYEDLNMIPVAAGQLSTVFAS